MEKVIREHQEIFRTDPRNPYVAFVLSLLLPGLGQVYNGQIKKAIIFLGLELVMHFLFGITRGATSFYGLSSLLVVSIAFRIFIAIDAAKNAKRQADYILKPYNTWYYHLLIAIGVIVVLNIYSTSRLLGIKTFKVSSGSNDPTVRYGDCVVADTKVYKNKEPEYGDIVTYQKQSGEIYCFRVVGKPNDKLDIIDNIVSINGKQSSVRFIKDTISYETPVAEFEEILPNGRKHLIYKVKGRFVGEKSNLKGIVVPPNSFYLLGDSRDNAVDSRYGGSIQKNKIIGQIIYSYWGETSKRINIDFRSK